MLQVRQQKGQAMDQQCAPIGMEPTETAELPALAAAFAGQIATAVWLGRLTDAAAREALGSYALACQPARWARERMGAALWSEYRRCRERQDACS